MDKSKYRQRLIDPKVDFYLSTFGAVCIEGPKWCGKTWTSTMHAKSAFMLADPEDNFANRELAKMDVSKALVGRLYGMPSAIPLISPRNPVAIFLLVRLPRRKKESFTLALVGLQVSPCIL